MKKAQLSGSLRANVGKKDTSAVRKADRVPCVLYGQGEQIHFSVRSVDVQKLIFSPDIYQVELDIDGQKKAAIIQDMQIHPVKDTALHVDFLELSDSKPVKVSLPLRHKGNPIGVLNGGTLRQPYRKLRVVGLPDDIPDEIIVDVEHLRIGQSIKVSELDSDGVEFLEPSNAVVIGVKIARNALEEEEEEEEVELDEDGNPIESSDEEGGDEKGKEGGEGKSDDNKEG